MTMTINCIDEMNLYFHMQNHYKKLRSAKSKINNVSKGFPNLPSSRSEKLLRVSNCKERHEKICPILQHHNRQKQNSTKSKSEPCMTSGSLQFKVQKNQGCEIPQQLQFMRKGGKKRNKLLKKVQRNDENKAKEIQHMSNDNSFKDEKISTIIDEKENIISLETDRTIVENNIAYSTACTTERERITFSRAEEHEYLQFLLRITEDIIINNYSRTEDIEKVFQHHIEVNVERLKMEKMMSQIASLSSALNISCDKYNTSDQIYEKHMFEPSNESFDYSLFKGCECSNRRHLFVADKQSIIDAAPSIMDKLCLNKEENLNNEKQDTLSQTTESIISLDMLAESLKYPSEIEIPQSHIIEVLHFSETKEENITTSSKVALDGIHPTDSSVTKIETGEELCQTKDTQLDVCLKKCSSEEESLKNLHDKRNDASKIYLSPKNNMSTQTEEESVENVALNTDKKLKRELTFVKSSSILEENRKADTSEKGHSNESVPPLVYSMIQKNNDRVDKCTQITIQFKDEECDTTIDNLNDIDSDAGYVLINGPLYILKGALSPERRIVLSEENHVDIDVAPVKERPSQVNHNSNNIVEDNLNLSDYSVLTETDSSLNYLNNVSFSRLLHSDYDLTPQRDDCSNKYHYLMVDAYTSISNANLRSQQSKDLLSRSEHYLNANGTENSPLLMNINNYQYCSNADEMNRNINQEDNHKSLTTVEEAHQNLLAKSEEYLLKSFDSSIVSSANDGSRAELLLKHFMVSEESENTRKDTQLACRTSSATTNPIDMYKIEGKGKKSSTEKRIFHLRRHRSLQ